MIQVRFKTASSRILYFWLTKFIDKPGCCQTTRLVLVNKCRKYPSYAHYGYLPGHSPLSPPPSLFFQVEKQRTLLLKPHTMAERYLNGVSPATIAPGQSGEKSFTEIFRLREILGAQFWPSRCTLLSVKYDFLDIIFLSVVFSAVIQREMWELGRWKVASSVMPLLRRRGRDGERGGDEQVYSPLRFWDSHSTQAKTRVMPFSSALARLLTAEAWSVRPPRGRDD